MGPFGDIIFASNHLLTQLALIGLKIKVLKFKLWSSLGISLGITISQCCILIIEGLCIMGVGASMGFQDFVIIFLDEALS
jgi:hypothetical protein